MTDDELKQAKQDNTARKAAVIIVTTLCLCSIALVFWVAFRLLNAILP